MLQETQQIENNYTIREDSELYQRKLGIGYERTCECKKTHINCMTAKEWLKSQLGVWQFYYEKRDIRKKEIHPAIFPMHSAL